MLEKLVELINANVPEAKAQLIKVEAETMQSSILVESAAIYNVTKFLKTNSELPFNALQVISGVDYTEYLEVNYIFAHFDNEAGRDLILKVRVADRINGNVDSIVELYPAADFQERECYDMIGVRFNNHPDHRRILCPDDWEGFPLRRDYVAQKDYNGMEVYPDDKMNMDDREFIVRQKMIKKQQEEKAN